MKVVLELETADLNLMLENFVGGKLGGRYKAISHEFEKVMRLPKDVDPEKIAEYEELEELEEYSWKAIVVLEEQEIPAGSIIPVSMGRGGPIQMGPAITKAESPHIPKIKSLMIEAKQAIEVIDKEKQDSGKAEFTKDQKDRGNFEAAKDKVYGEAFKMLKKGTEEGEIFNHLKVIVDGYDDSRGKKYGEGLVEGYNRCLEVFTGRKLEVK